MELPDKFMLSESEFQELVNKHGTVMVVETIEEIVNEALESKKPTRVPFLHLIERKLSTIYSAKAMN